MPKASLVAVLLALSVLPAGFGLAQVTNDTVTNDTGEAPATNETEGNATDGEPATPAAPEPVTIVLTGHGEGGKFFFRIEGESANNPRLTVAPGAEVTVVLKTVSGSIHNFCTDATGTKTCTKLVSEGEEDSVTFTAPEGGTFEYWCDPHRGSGMKGQLVVAAAGGGDGGGEGDGEAFAGETVDLGDLGYADCAGTKVPVASAEQAVGGPTVADYVQKCRSGDSAPAGRPTHPADYVIPASIVLIGLGVVGVVWVSRSDRPCGARMADPYGDAWDEDHARIHFSGREVLHLLASVVVLTVAFSLVLGARKGDFPPSIDVDALVTLLPYAALAVVPAFILHELAHKVVAQRRDMWAEFRANPFGLVGGLLVTWGTGFLFALPGAVEIVGHADKRDAGVISIVGPMVNVGIAGLAMALEPFFKPIRVADFGSFFELIVLLNLILAGFNMLPLGPLDGRKVWSWSVLGFFGMWALILGLGFVAIAL